MFYHQTRSKWTPPRTHPLDFNFSSVTPCVQTKRHIIGFIGGWHQEQFCSYIDDGWKSIYEKMVTTRNFCKIFFPFFSFCRGSSVIVIGAFVYIWCLLSMRESRLDYFFRHFFLIFEFMDSKWIGTMFVIIITIIHRYYRSRNWRGLFIEWTPVCWPIWSC